MDIHNEVIDNNRLYYDTNSVGYITSTMSMDLSDKYPMFLRFIPDGGLILDLGCGSGRDGKNFISCGYSVEGIDVSAAMVEAAVREGVNAQQKEFNQINDYNKYDGIWACASLLHVPKSEIKEIMIRLWNALKPNGVIFISLKVGHGEKISKDGRFFAYYGDSEFDSIILCAELWKVESKKLEKVDSTKGWLNYILTAQKQG